MSAGLIVQYVALALIVLTSVLVVFRKLAPQLTNRWLATASIHFARKHDSRLARALSRRLQPKQATGDCSDGCATCGACGPTRPAAAQTSMHSASGSKPDGQARVAVEPMPLNFRSHLR